MKHKNLLMGIIIIIIALGLAGCGEGSSYEKIEPAELVDQGDGRNLVILTEKAAERLGIQTETVGKEEIALTRDFGGQVMEASTDGGTVVKVVLTADEFDKIDPAGPASVFPFDIDDAEDSDEEGFSAKLDDMLGIDDDEDSVMKTMYYSVEGSDFVPDQRLKVEVSIKDESGPRLVVPFSSLIYDIYGGTWVYINTGDLQFLRVPVEVDFISGDKVVLNEGPDVGTAVVTVGVAELHGTDTGVGK